MICFLHRCDFVLLLAGSQNQEWTTAAHLAVLIHLQLTGLSVSKEHSETEDQLFPMLCLLMKVINEVGLNFQSSMFYVSF